jgi:hypothetical protein
MAKVKRGTSDVTTNYYWLDHTSTLTLLLHHYLLHTTTTCYSLLLSIDKQSMAKREKKSTNYDRGMQEHNQLFIQMFVSSLKLSIQKRDIVISEINQITKHRVRKKIHIFPPKRVTYSTTTGVRPSCFSQKKTYSTTIIKSFNINILYPNLSA